MEKLKLECPECKRVFTLQPQQTLMQDTEYFSALCKKCKINLTITYGYLDEDEYKEVLDSTEDINMACGDCGELPCICEDTAEEGENYCNNPYCLQHNCDGKHETITEPNGVRHCLKCSYEEVV